MSMIKGGRAQKSWVVAVLILASVSLELTERAVRSHSTQRTTNGATLALPEAMRPALPSLACESSSRGHHNAV